MSEHLPPVAAFTAMLFTLAFFAAWLRREEVSNWPQSRLDELSRLNREAAKKEARDWALIAEHMDELKKENL